MAEVSITIAGRDYRVACRDGEEDNLRSAAAIVDARGREALAGMGALSEARTLLFASLLIADQLIERILFLEGHPNVQRLDPVRIGESVPEQFTADLAVEVHAVDALRRGIVICQGTADTVTRLLLESILASEEEHMDYLETQLSLLQNLGEPQYLAQQL